MGKYMKKAKIAGDVAVLEVSHHQSSLGVRTRARTLALRRLQKPPAPEESSYLQLRSRRLEKPPAPKPNEPCEESPCSTPDPNPSFSPSPSPYPSPSPSPSSKSSPTRLGGEGPLNSASVVGSVSIRSCCLEKEGPASEASPESDTVVEVSFGDNVLEVEARSRNARETTPCSMIRDSETIVTPGSTTRPTNNAIVTNRRTQNPTCRNIPTTQQMEEFFAGSEELQQTVFKEKYNFDPVNDQPLPGRYEWVKLDGVDSSSSPRR